MHNLNSASIEKVYVGQPDACACGCKGVYSYSSLALTAAETDVRRRFLAQLVNDQEVARVTALVIDHPQSVVGENNVSLEHDGKLHVIFPFNT